MKKSYCITANIVLLVWFFLDMIGIYFGNKYLVTCSWREDGIFFLIFLTIFFLFLWKEKIGRYALCIWLFLWLITQFFSHEWFTIMGNGQGKIKYFKNAIKWMDSDVRYIPDLYHTILHILIAIAFITTIIYCIKPNKKQK